jgi:hypothetical protein
MYGIREDVVPCCRMKTTSKASTHTTDNRRAPKNKGRANGCKKRKRSQHNKRGHKQVAGDLIYWEYNAAIKSSVGEFIDTLNTVGCTQKHSISHCVVSPAQEAQLIAKNSNGGLYYPCGDRSSDIIFKNVILPVADAFNPDHFHTLKAYIIMSFEDAEDALAVTQNTKDNTFLAKSIFRKKKYLDQKETSVLCSKGYDVVVILFSPKDKEVDFFPYVRWIGHQFRVPQIDPAVLDQKLQAFMSRLPHGGYEVLRKGGSNGFLSLNQDLFKFMSIPNTGPRQAWGSIWIPSKNNLRWHMLYINCFESRYRKITGFDYAPPVRGGQFLLKEKDTEFDSQFGSFLKLFAKTKAMTPSLCTAISNYLSGVHHIHRGVASHATLVQSYTNGQMRDGASCENVFYSKLLQSCHFTLIMHAVGIHVDRVGDLYCPLRGLTTSFFEN